MKNVAKLATLLKGCSTSWGKRGRLKLCVNGVGGCFCPKNIVQAMLTEKQKSSMMLFPWERYPNTRSDLVTKKAPTSGA